jgi:hypothetical protein
VLRAVARSDRERALDGATAQQELAWLRWRLDRLIDLPRPFTTHETDEFDRLSVRLVELLR